MNQTQSDRADSSGSPSCGALEVLWTADERLTSPYRWKFFYRYDAASTAGPALASLRGLDHAGIIRQANQFGFSPIPKRQRDIHLQWIAQLDTISRTPIGGRALREWLRFEGVSLWHFIPECCYLGSAAALQETIELIEYLTDLIERFRPSRLVVASRWNDHQRAVVSLISRRYRIPAECITLESAQPAAPEPPRKDNPDPHYRSLESGQSLAVRDYVAGLRKSLPAPVIGKDPVLLVSFPRAWTQTTDRGRIDIYFEAFRSFFQERGLSPIRVDVPYYFQMECGVKNYIDDHLQDSSNPYPTIFLDEYGTDAIWKSALQGQSELGRLFQGWIQDPDFHQALSWKGISLVTPLVSFWQKIFVEHLAVRCIPAMLTARRMLDAIRPRAILLSYETGSYAQAILIEAHRRGIPSLGLQHAAILPEHEYYLHDDIVHRPDLSQECDGRIVCTRTLLFGPDAQRILTQPGRYPLEATEVLGCDYRILVRGTADRELLRRLKSQWSPSGRKIVLVLGQPSLTYGLLNQAIAKLSPSEYSVLIKLHPADKSGPDYRDWMEDRGFEVSVIRDFLPEAIEAAELVFALVSSTAGLESLFAGKPVFTLRDLDLPYTVPWERFTTDLASVDSIRITEQTPQQKIELQRTLEDLGYSQNWTLKDFHLRLHSIFDSLYPKDPAMTFDEVSKTASRLGYQLVKFGGYIDCAKTVAAAAEHRQSVCEYVERLWGVQGSTQRVIEEMRKAGCFQNLDSVCEIGPGTGRYLEGVLQRGQVSRYSIYETAADWAQWLESTYSVVRRNADGETLKFEEDRSCHLVHAHGVFVYLKYLQCFRYFKEMIRICRPGGYIVFDFFPDDLFDVSLIQTYLSRGEHYPSVLNSDTVKKFFLDHGARLVSQFTHPYGHGRSQYHVYQIPAFAGHKPSTRPQSPPVSANGGSGQKPAAGVPADPSPVRRRNPFVVDVSDYAAAVSVVNRELQAGRLLNALDVCEQIADAHPGKAAAFLAVVYDLLKSQPNFKSRFLYQSRFFDFGIQPGWKVLDIGSGHDPFPMATHLADRAIQDNQLGRGGAPFKALQGRPVFECSVEKMPFSDKEFDFVFCSHVLEHVEDPEQACRELMRVARRGYIETPTPGKDLFFDYARVSNHRWAVEWSCDRLVFNQYTPRQIQGLSCDLLNQFLENPQSDREKAFSALMFLKADRINTMLLWQDQFAFEVRRPVRTAASGVESGVYASGIGSSGDSAQSQPSVSAESFQTQPTVSAVIPTHNRAAYLPRAIQSVLSQTRPVDEIVIADDGSTDDTESLIARMRSQYPKIRYIRLPQNGGAQRARNAGIRAASGEWIAFLDSDDVWLPDRIRLCLEKARQMNVPAVHTEAYMRRNGQLSLMKRSSAQGYIFPDLLKCPGPTFPGLMVRKECLLRVGLLDESLPAWQEWDAFLRLSQYFKFGYVAEPCFVWDAHENETISKDKSRDLAGYERIVATWKDQILQFAGPEALEKHYQTIARKRAALSSAIPESSKMGQAQMRDVTGATTVV